MIRKIRNIVRKRGVSIYTSNTKCIYFRNINSLLNSLEFNKNELKQLKIKIFVIDYNSKKEDLDKIYEKFRSKNYEFEIIKLKLDDFKGIKTLNKDNPDIEKNMKSTMASIYTSLEIAKNKCDDLIYFVEDDYIHKKESILEIISAYEKVSSELGKELFICPVDYPYLYKKLGNSKIFIGNKYHWRTINESLLTFLTSKSLVVKYWKDLIFMSQNEHAPFETPLHKIYEKEICISRIPSLAIHCTNINSILINHQLIIH